MGQQIHEAELSRALAGYAGGRWAVRERSLVSLRSGVGGRRVPLRLVWAAPFPLAAAAGSLLYGRADLVHRLDLRCPPSITREVVTVHDLPPLRFDDEGSLPSWGARSARAAALVICPSEFAAAEARALLGVTRTRVVPNGVDLTRAEAAPFSDAELDSLGIALPFVLHAGGATKRKNLAALAAAWPAVLAEHPDARLVLCGPPHPRRDELFATVANARYLGHRDSTFVARLMRTAAAVVVPSTYEGFGLPALEAMAAGTPVVAAARGALPEVCGDGAALLVEPTPAELARGIGETLAGGDPVDARVAAGLRRAREFTWEHAARATASVYDEAIGERV
ncbi:MAG TPA: glycosyltransferase family 1 protein [Gaiellaceae bacterium]|jgi:glycosyltransferase involved in cell wall biosynthesis|nr:glycosyltransferase family 1 protein [Gaiellaceae bacterium]